MDQHNGIQYIFQNEWHKLNTAAQYIRKMKAMNSKIKNRFLSLQIVRYCTSMVYTVVCTARMLGTQKLCATIPANYQLTQPTQHILHNPI